MAWKDNRKRKHVHDETSSWGIGIFVCTSFPPDFTKFCLFVDFNKLYPIKFIRIEVKD